MDGWMFVVCFKISAAFEVIVRLLFAFIPAAFASATASKSRKDNSRAHTNVLSCLFCGNKIRLLTEKCITWSLSDPAWGLETRVRLSGRKVRNSGLEIRFRCTPGSGFQFEKQCFSVSNSKIWKSNFLAKPKFCYSKNEKVKAAPDSHACG